MFKLIFKVGCSHPILGPETDQKEFMCTFLRWKKHGDKFSAQILRLNTIENE